MFAIASAVLAATLSSSSALADDNCRLSRIAKLEMTTLSDGTVGVPMTINGKTVMMQIGTASVYSTLRQSDIEGLGLKSEYAGGGILKVYGGETSSHFAAAYGASFAGITARRIAFPILPDKEYPRDANGSLGPDILRSYDLDLDFANSTFSLFSQDHCDGKVVYWTQGGYARIEFTENQNVDIVVPVELDGKRINAVINTAMERSAASLPEIENDFDIDSHNPDLKQLTSYTTKFPAYHYPFKTLSFGGVTITNPDLELASADEWREVSFVPAMRIILGIDILRKLHVYIAYREHAIYVTPATAH
jgi:hypothetical protein